MKFSRTVFKWIFGRRLPIVDGSLQVNGLEQPITIRRDRWGIPHIAARSELDAWYGVGFCQGQDRGFQIESLKRVACGTLSELIGSRGLSIDRLSRRIGFRRAAQRQLEAQQQEARAILDAFARGVSAGVTVGVPARPHELALLRRPPTPTSPTEILATLNLQAFLLASNWDVELARLMILRADGPRALAALDPSYAHWHPVTTPPGQAAERVAERLVHDLEILGDAVGLGAASNNWVLAARKTATGRPLVANDPHLPPMVPPHWYLLHLEIPSGAAAGAGFVGAPGIPAGHNGHAAWGITAALIDNTDTYIEQLGPDRRSVRVGDDFEPCEVVDEVITVRGGPPVVEQVLLTRHGPIVGPALAGELDAISMQATWMRAEPMQGMLQLQQARSFERFREISSAWSGIPLNVVYADVEGTTGWQLIGRAPKRRKGYSTCPLPGSDPEVGWEPDPIPFEAMPHARDPAEGYIATANNQPHQNEDGPFLGVDWLEGYRLARIAERLEADDDWDVAKSLRLQVDQVSLPWQEMRSVVLAAAEQAGEHWAVELLGRWDGVVAADSPAAGVFELFVAEMAHRIVRAKAPNSAKWALGRGFAEILPHSLFALRRVSHMVQLFRDQPPGWFEGSWAEEIGQSIAAVGHRLRRDHGEDPSGWQWGRLRTLELRHPLGESRLLRAVFNLGPFPWGGDANTVAQASVDPQKPTANPIAIASLRMVVDVGDWERARFSMPGGQSGNPLSPHYDDLLPIWRASRGVPIAFSTDAVTAATVSTLTLAPGPAL